MKPKLYCVYTAKEILEMFPNILFRNHMANFPLPTEVVIGIGKYVQTAPFPDFGRVWATNNYNVLIEDGIMSYDELMKYQGKNFKGTGYFEEIVVCETYEDCGDDGHVNYILDGYKPILMKDFKQACEETITRKSFSRGLHEVFQGRPGEQWGWRRSNFDGNMEMHCLPPSILKEQ